MTLHGHTRDWPKATLEDGTAIAHHVHKGNGPARIVLIHALAMNGRYWDQVVPLLKPYGDVLVYDCRGHGVSDISGQPYSTSQFADDLVQLLDRLGWGRAVVAGASMGGCIALSFAGRHPERLGGLGLIDTTAWYGPDAPANWAARGDKGHDEGLSALIDFQLQRWFSTAYAESNPAVVESLIEVFLANDRTAYRSTCNMLGAADERQTLANIDCPCVVVVGELDKATPVAMAQHLADTIPGASLEIVPDCHHFLPIERPDRVTHCLASILGNATPADDGP